MNSFHKQYDGRQHMLRPDFELLHLRDIMPTEVQEHRHAYYELLFVVAGSNLSYQVGDDIHKVVPNNIILINSETEHHPIVNPHSIYERLLLWLTPEFVRSISYPDFPLWHCFEDPLSKGRNVLYMKPKHLALMQHAILRFEWNYFSNLYGHEHLTRVYLEELLMMLNRTYLDVVEGAVEEAAPSNRMIESVVEYILANLSSAITLDSLSERFFVNKYYLLREFKKHVGYTIHQYIQEQRLKQASRLIQSDALPLTEICYMCGFSDYSSFFRLFKRRYGISPGQYGKE